MPELRNVTDMFGEVHQTSLTMDADDTRPVNIHTDMLGIVLRSYTSDDYRNRYSHQFEDRHGHMHVADVLVLNDGAGSAYLLLSHVVIPPNAPSGVDNYEEFLPRGSDRQLSGDAFDTALHNIDPYELDGDWCVVRFIGGTLEYPYIASYWPNPRNKYDTQTSGAGNPTSEGEGTSLVQAGRYFRRINGVETVINRNGDIFLSTNYAGSFITAGEPPARGRFARATSATGGGIRVNVKPQQAMELNWNEEEDGIGLNDVHDHSLPQENPPKTQPITAGSRDNTFIRYTSNLVSFEVPTLFSATSNGSIRLASDSNFGIIVGGDYVSQVSGISDTIAQGNLYAQSVGGNLVLASGTLQVQELAEEQDEDFRALVEGTGNIQVWTENDFNVEAELGNIALLTDVGNITTTATLGSIAIDATAQDVSISGNTGISLSALLGPISVDTASTLSFAGSGISFSLNTAVPGLPGGDTIELGGTNHIINGDQRATDETTFLEALKVFVAATMAPGAAKTTMTAAIDDFIASFTDAFSDTVTMG